MCGGMNGCMWGVCMCVQSIFYCWSHQKKSRDRILYLCFLLGFFGRWIPGFTTWGESAHSSSSLSCNPPSGSLLGRLDCDEFLETIYEDGEMDISSCDTTTMHKDKPGLFKHYRSWLVALSAKLRPGKLDWMFRITTHFLWDLPLQLSLATLEEALCDHFVCGLRHNTIQRRLLSETTLTYNKALDSAKEMEAADQNTKAFRIPEPTIKALVIIRLPSNVLMAIALQFPESMLCLL